MKRNSLLTFMVIVLMQFAWVGCAPSTDNSQNKQPSAKETDAEKIVNVYTHRHYDTDQQLFDQFEAQTGIKVNVVKSSADELINRLEVEGTSSQADVLVTADAGRLHRAKAKGLLQPVNSETINESVPANLRDSDNQWIGLTQRARVIVYAKDRVDPKELSTYEALTDPKWKGKILVRSSGNIYNQSLMASMVHHLGLEGAKTWAEGVVANFARDPKGNDRDQVKAVVAGVGDLAIINTYYLGLLLNSEDEGERTVGESVGIFFPDQEGNGTHVNVSGIGITKHAPHPTNSMRLIEFLVSEEAQGQFASRNYEYPVNPSVKPSELLQSWGDFSSDKINLSLLGTLNKDAVMAFDQAGWK